MTFKIYNKNYNIRDLVRKLGYKPIGVTEKGELNCVRPLAGDYPRFHIYLREDKDVIVFNLHLDQKKPIYEGTIAHSGDYESDTVKAEVQRIKDVIFR
ncbi:MAG: hypothetical protein HY378_00915 [Candidatus Brennerbacteria bacterium]|nr:hypothetical protein [Candidatus Brennerbacteria bacterium]